MNIVRWEPFRELELRSQWLNRLFGWPPGPARGVESGKESLTLPDWAPSVDIVETPEEFQLKVELPEVSKEDVKVTVDSGVLRIEGERKLEKEEKGKKFHRIERHHGCFLRTFVLPENVEQSEVRAEFKEGLLNVRLLKSEEAKPKSIEVKVA